MNRVCSRILLTAVLLTFVATTVFAQSDTATVSGIVKDPSSAVIPKAKIALKSQATGQLRAGETNDSGLFIFPGVPAGFYTLTIEAQGFKKYESKDNKVDPALPASFDVTMQVGATTETVEVTATVAAIQTESGALGKLVEGKQISDLQLNGRNPLFLALLKPGVRGGSLAGFSYDLTTGGLNINGSRTQDNLITYDGAVAVRTRSNGTSIGTADLDMTSEVQILTSSYSAEYGRSSGGQVRIVTKGGTSQFHGGAYEYFRNSQLDANSWARNTVVATNFVAPFRFNQFGWNFSGPLYIPGKFNADRSKLFFIYSQEFTRYRRDDTNTRTVPSTLMKQGNFSELLTANLWFSGTRTVYDPTTPIDPVTGKRSPFAGNIIPASRQSANGMALLRVYPDPNLAIPLGTSNWYGVAGHPTNQRKDNFGVDFLPTSKDYIKVRGQFFSYYDLSPFQTNFLIAGRIFDRPNQTGTVTWTHTFSPTLLHELTVAASRDQVFIGMEDTPAFDRTKYGINYAYVFPAGKDRPNKLPALNMNGFSDYTGSPYPSSSTGPIYQISDNLTKVWNNHTFKTGFYFERAGQNDYDQINVQGVPGGTDNQNGRFQFSDSRPGGSSVAIGDAALGLFDSYAEIGTRSFTPYRGHMYEWYVQDAWKVTQKLKLEFGVRHTIVQPYYSLWGNMVIFDPKYYDASKAMKIDPKTGNPIAGTGDPYNGLVFPGSSWPDAAKGRVPAATDASLQYLFRGGQEPRYYSNIDYGNFQPRVGIAYSLNPKTVIRAGGGKFTTRLGVSDSVFLGGNPPLQPIASIPTGNVDNPGGGSQASFALSPSSQAKDFHMPQSYTWNFTMEREVGYNTVVDITYTGRRGLYGQREKNINQPLPGTLQRNPGVNINYLRPYAGYGPIRMTFNDSNSTYNGFQAGVNRRFTNGLAYGFAYTLSSCMDGGSAQRDVIPNAYDASMLWGHCTYDNRHIAVINWIYELPFFRQASNQVVKAVAGGWQISGVTQFQTGTPFTVNTTDDFAGVGPGSGNNFNSFWKVNGTPNQDAQFATFAGENAYWYNPANNTVWTRPDAGTFVTDRVRNKFYNPGFQNWNISMFKTFALTERHKLLFRFDAFNWINHPNWSSMETNPTRATFGKITSKSDQRNLQLALRYSF